MQPRPPPPARGPGGAIVHARTRMSTGARVVLASPKLLTRSMTAIDNRSKAVFCVCVMGAPRR